MNSKDFNLWEGVYQVWDEAPQDDGVFEEDIWISKITEQAKKDREDLRSIGTLSYDYVLPIICAMTVAQNKEILRILDFGGGLGRGFFSLVGSLPLKEKIEFHVVETKAVSEQGQKLFADEPGLFFHDELPQLSDPVHIVHLGSTLQYVDDWISLIRSLASYQPKFLALDDVMAGDIKPFVTVQNFYGRKIRVRFLNVHELVAGVEGQGFRLIYKSQYVGKIFDNWAKLPMQNFDQLYRFDYPCQLIFERVI